MRFKAGEKMPDFLLETASGEKKPLSELAGSGKTALIFLRYYGCTLCQLNIHLYAKHYPEIVKEDGTILVVLQSTPESVQRQLTDHSLPFAIVCDPEARLHRQLEIPSAHSKDELLGGDAMQKVTTARQLFTHGEYEGDELQLPAAFIMNHDLTLTYVRYGTNGGDVPDPNELSDLLHA
jgi:peroxiredoxin